jgi:tRNA(Arg) A34 adenosine deaminase TadA
MTGYAGLKTEDLVATGAWQNEESADRYNHAVTNDQAKLADLLPVPKTINRLIGRKKLNTNLQGCL